MIFVHDWSLCRSTHAHTLTHKMMPHPTLLWSSRQQAKDTRSCSEDGHTWRSSRCMPHSHLLHSQAWFRTAPLSSHLLRTQIQRKDSTNSWECWAEPHRPNLHTNEALDPGRPRASSIHEVALYHTDVRTDQLHCR